MTPEKLRAMLQKTQEPKGYFFNKDHEFVQDLMENLLINKERYGYMSCPCRLSAGQKDIDRDIICPCVYREDDVREFGACYCGLYVSEDWNAQPNPQTTVPERRDPEKMLAALLAE